MKRSASKLAGVFEKLGRNAFEKLGNAIAETATAITENLMANPVVPRITTNPAATMGNLTASPADIPSITASQVTITENPMLATVTPPMAIPRFFPE